MSPEMQNEDEYNNKKDVYSYGIALYVVFTGSIQQQKMKDRLNKIPQTFSSLSDSISAVCIGLINECLQYEPKSRTSFQERLEYLFKNGFSFAGEVDDDINTRRYKELKRFEGIHDQKLDDKSK